MLQQKCPWSLLESTQVLKFYREKGVFVEKGPVFHGKGALHRGDGEGGGFGGRVFTENPRRWGRGGRVVSTGNLGGRGRPLYREEKAPFWWKRLKIAGCFS